MIFNDPKSALNDTQYLSFEFPHLVIGQLVLPTHDTVRSSAEWWPRVDMRPVGWFFFWEFSCSLALLFNISLFQLLIVSKDHKPRRCCDFEMPCFWEVFECLNPTLFIECLLRGMLSWKSFTTSHFSQAARRCGPLGTPHPKAGRWALPASPPESHLPTGTAALRSGGDKSVVRQTDVACDENTSAKRWLQRYYIRQIPRHCPW